MSHQGIEQVSIRIINHVLCVLYLPKDGCSEVYGVAQNWEIDDSADKSLADFFAKYQAHHRAIDVLSPSPSLEVRHGSRLKHRHWQVSS